MFSIPRTWRLALVLLTALIVPALTIPAQSAAADTIPVLPAGQACAFPLQVTQTGGHLQTGFNDRLLFAGNGYTLTFTNLATSKSVTYQTPGSVARITSGAGGTAMIFFSGFNGIILSPTDNAASVGLSTPGVYLFVGRAVVSVAASGNWTVQSVPRDVTDICAALS